MDSKDRPESGSSAVRSATKAIPARAGGRVRTQVRRKQARVRRVLLCCCAGILLFTAAGAASCGVAGDLAANNQAVASQDGSSPVELTAESIRQYALAALRAGGGWKVEVAGTDGSLEVDWWSANSSYYRWDIVSGGATSSGATDGTILLLTAGDETVTGRPLGADSAYPPNPTQFTTYYWYLAGGKPLGLGSGADSQSPLVVRLMEAPSGLTAALDPETFLPIALEGRSEVSGDTTTRAVQIAAISLEEIKELFAEMQAKVSPAR